MSPPIVLRPVKEADATEVAEPSGTLVGDSKVHVTYVCGACKRTIAKGVSPPRGPARFRCPFCGVVVGE